MNPAFQALIKRLLQEQGAGILEHPALCRGLLSDYAKGTHKQEIRRFLRALEGGWYQELCHAKNPEAERPRLVRRLTEEYTIPPAEAGEIFALLAPPPAPLEPEVDDATAQRIETLEKAARKGDYRAMYDLGLLLEKLTWYEESNYWFKKAAKQGLLLFEQYLKEKPPLEKEEKDPLEKKFVKIPGGTFLMGSPITDPGWRAEETQHQVQVSGFYLSRYAVTQGEYKAVTGTNPSRFIGDTLPVEHITWFEAATYCNARSLMEKLTPAYTIRRETITWNRTTSGYRLPTEAEWEYACRAGTTKPFSTGKRITTDQANYNGTADVPPGAYRRKTTPVGTFPPNPWGLYDMHGNCYEWCWDWYGQYGITIQRDPVGPASGDTRIIRGGSWNYATRSLRSAARNSDAPTRRSASVGFRLLLPL